MFTNLTQNLTDLMNNYKAGQVSHCLHEWQALTSDPEILRIVKGDYITLTTMPPTVHTARRCKVSPETEALMGQEIQGMLDAGIIVETRPEDTQYVSPIFPVVKATGTMRIILNLKQFNEHVEYLHFKMDNIKVVLSNVTKGCFMASLDLKNAYHSVRIDEDFQKYLKFTWNNTLYQYTCYPNGLGPCPRKFTKLLKVPLSHLREKLHIIIGYLDDFFMQGKNHNKCAHTLNATITLLQRLGFTINPHKSNLFPSQELVFLGFVINSVTMTVALTTEKKEKLIKMIHSLLLKDTVSIRKVATIIGKMVSSLPGSLYGPLYYRTLELDKNKALKRNRGNYESPMEISQEGKMELVWWKNNLPNMNAPIQWPPITIEMCTDASGKIGWGATIPDILTTGGAWTREESELHINVKEMIAILYGLRSFVDTLKGQHTRVLCDNTTAVFVVNKMGTTRSPSCNAMAKEIWEYCKGNNMFITCAHIPGIQNVVADRESRKEHKQSEWMLNRNIFNAALSHFNITVDIDCFATRINTQLEKYVSRHPDPFAHFIDAFSFNWKDRNAYIFPPFSLVNKVLQKLRIDKARALCVFPQWTTQAWWPIAQEMMVCAPMIIPPAPKNLVLPNKIAELHPLHKKLALVICLISGDDID